MTLRPKHEIRLLVEFQFRSCFAFNNWLQNNQYDHEEAIEVLTGFSQMSIAILYQMRPEGNTRDMSMYGKTMALYQMMNNFQKEYNEYCHEWKEIMDAGYPEPLRTTKLELAAAIHIDNIVEGIYDIFSETNISEQ